VEGEHLIQEAYDAGFLAMVLWEKEASYRDVETIMVSEEIIGKLSDVQSNQGIIGVCNFPKEKDIKGHVLLLDRIQDPGNMGTLIRSALAFGFNTVVMDQCVDVYNPKVIRATQGAIFKINMIEVDILDFMDQHQDIDYMVTDLSATNHTIQDFSHSIGLILGNEGRGVRQAILSKANHKIKIRMQHTESLNVAVAGSILMYELGGKQ